MMTLATPAHHSWRRKSNVEEHKIHHTLNYKQQTIHDYLQRPRGVMLTLDTMDYNSWLGYPLMTYAME